MQSHYITSVSNACLPYEELVCLIVGKVYKLAPPEPNDGDLLRVIDESGEDYLYPASYFEPLLVNDKPATDSVNDSSAAVAQGRSLCRSRGGG